MNNNNKEEFEKRFPYICKQVDDWCQSKGGEEWALKHATRIIDNYIEKFEFNNLDELIDAIRDVYYDEDYFEVYVEIETKNDGYVYGEEDMLFKSIINNLDIDEGLKEIIFEEFWNYCSFGNYWFEDRVFEIFKYNEKVKEYLLFKINQKSIDN